MLIAETGRIQSLPISNGRDRSVHRQLGMSHAHRHCRRGERPRCCFSQSLGTAPCFFGRLLGSKVGDLAHRTEQGFVVHGFVQ